jgi:hypothetical protein
MAYELIYDLRFVIDFFNPQFLLNRKSTRGST